MTREELIAALERAEGPSRELDRAIADLVDPDIERFGMRLVMRDVATLCETGDIKRDLVPPFTASIDAALTLVMPGHDVGIYIWNDCAGSSSARASVNGHACGKLCANAAIALVIAALRARGGA